MQEREQALLFIRRGADAAHLIAGGVDCLPELTLIQRLVGQNDGLALHVGGGNLFDVQRAADCVVHMGFAHGTGHTGYLHSRLNHNNPSFWKFNHIIAQHWVSVN